MDEYARAEVNLLHAESQAKSQHKQRCDPVTGDVLTGGEYISWKVQGVIRRWHFLIFITLLTVLVWTTNNPVALLWWNLAASYMALVIESVVGIAMFSQTKRDAVCLREVRAMSQRIEDLTKLLLKDVEQLEAEIQEEQSS